jgi:hypothetical protein
MFRNATPSRVDQLWSEQKKKLLLQFTNLTEKDFYFEIGRKHEMIEKLSIKLGKSELEIKHIFEAL